MADATDPSRVRAESETECTQPQIGPNSGEPVPWDAPSRLGPVGRLGRRALRRILRPYEVRDLAREERLRAELRRLEQRLEVLGTTQIAALGRRLDDRLGEMSLGLTEVELGLRTNADRFQESLETVEGRVDARLIELRRTAVGRVEALESTVGLTRALATPRLQDLGLAAGARSTVVRGSTDVPRVICSLATGPHLDYLAVSGSAMVEYARRWGWDLILSAEDLAHGRPPAWGKVRLIRAMLDLYDWVLWLDADAIFVDSFFDVTDTVRPGKDLYLVEHRWGSPVQHVPNAGVMLVRSSDWSRMLFDRIWEAESVISHPWWDNAALMQIIGYDLEPARLARPNSDTAKVELLDVSYNSIPLDPSPLPKINHYAGIGDGKTGLRDRLLSDLALFRQGADRLVTQAPSQFQRSGSVDIGVVRSRKEIPHLLNTLGLCGCGVEVGVQQGEYSEMLLRTWCGVQLISVDPWAPDEPEAYRDIANVALEEHEANLLVARDRLGRFAGRCDVWRMASVDAAGRFSDGCVDFVYLDARHDEASVTQDLRAWWRTIRPGGLMAGHDYVDGELAEGRFGVKAAVDRFFTGKGLFVRSTVDDEWPSWLVLRPSRSIPA